MNDAMTVLIDKIRKLRRKAEGTTNENEAAAFAAKVQELMAEHGLQEEVLEEKNPEDAAIEKEEYRTKSGSVWRGNLMHQVSMLYMCRIVMDNRDRSRFTMFGRPHNLVIAKEMTEYLMDTTRRMSKKYARENEDARAVIASGLKGRASIEAEFRRGCGLRLAERCRELRERQTDQRPEWKPSGNPGNLPALYKTELAKVEEVMSRTFGKLKSDNRKVRGGSHADAGRAAADTVNLSAQLGGGASRSRMIGGPR